METFEAFLNSKSNVIEMTVLGALILLGYAVKIEATFTVKYHPSKYFKLHRFYLLT